jgi:hypothetical protein
LNISHSIVNIPRAESIRGGYYVGGPVTISHGIVTPGTDGFAHGHAIITPF